MTRRAQWLIVATVIVVLGGGVAAATYAMRDQFFPVGIGSRAPDFSARTLDAEPEIRGMADYRGDVVLLNIWATWCGPCRVEMPEIQALYSNFSTEGFRVVAVSIDNAGMEQAIRGFVRDYGLTFDILYDASGDIQRIYQSSGVPETFIIGRDGVIRKKVIGAIRWNSESNQALVRQLLAEPRPA